MHDPVCRRQLEDSIEQYTAILFAINNLDVVTKFIAAHDGESLESGLASLAGTSTIGARAILDCQFRRIAPKDKGRLVATLDLLKAELGKLGA